MADHSTDHSHEEHTEHHGNLGLFVMVFIGLILLTITSFGIANSPLMDNPLVGWVGMMTVSVCKALMVILFFMHLKWEANWKYVLTIPASIMSVFLILMLVPDVGERFNYYSEERLLHSADPAVVGDLAPGKPIDTHQPPAADHPDH